MVITTKGQVTIPIEIREKLGLHPGTRVDFVIEGDDQAVRIVKAADSGGRGAEVVQRLRGRARVTMTTDEIMALTRG